MPLGRNDAASKDRGNSFAKRRVSWIGNRFKNVCSNVTAAVLLHARKPGHSNELKRIFDVMVATALLALISPFMAVVAIGVKLDSPGPILFLQRRCGRSGKPFCIYKFRTMTVLEDGPVVAQAKRNDPRVTRIGRLLRRTSVDELPQLINVIRGEMSLVGPRPHALAHDEHYGRLIPNYHVRYAVLPGITGWAQVNGFRGETRSVEEMSQRVKCDLEYIDRCSVWLDIWILVRTPLRAFHKMAY
jgi:putative colanic acid biosysnthesis UDP-glucose lipid carrier transferase